MQRGFAGLVGVSDPGSQHVDPGVDDAAMPGVLDLLDVLDRIIEGFDEGALAQQQLIDHRHEFVAPILANFGDQPQTPIPSDLEKLLGNVAPIPDQPAGQTSGQLRDRPAIIDVAGGDLERQEFAPVVDHEMEFEAIKPAHGGFATPGDVLEDWVAMEAAIVANHPRSRVDKGDPGVLAPTGMEIDAHRHQRGGDRRHKPAIAQQVGKRAPAVPT